MEVQAAGDSLSDGVMSNAPTAQTNNELPPAAEAPRQAEMQPGMDVAPGDLESIREDSRIMKSQHLSKM